MSEKHIPIMGREFIKHLGTLGLIKDIDNVHSVTIRADCEDALWMEVERLCGEEMLVEGLLVGSEAWVVEDTIEA